MAFAHVDLESPIGGESLAGGSTYRVQWRLSIAHETNDWDLWYSTAGPEGPWVDLALDLPLGDPTEGSLHTYDWAVPNIDAPAAWVRVRQDNEGMDYVSVSSEGFAISATTDAGGDYNGDGLVDAADYTTWRDTLGGNNLAADGDLDGVVGRGDYHLWRERYGGGRSDAAAAAEPGTLAMLAMAWLMLVVATRTG